MAADILAPALDSVTRDRGWRSRTLPVLGRLVRNPFSLLSILIILGCIALAVFAPVLAPYPYDEQDILARLQAPSAVHWFGTDDVGRDILSRIIWGSRVSITVSFGAVAVGAGLGTMVGLCAGYFQGVVDLVSQRLVDFIMSMPALIIL